MKKSLLQHALMKLTLLLVILGGAMSAASAADRFYIDAVNVEPGETKTLAFILDNDQEFYGFQADISLPEGLDIVTTNGKPDITLSSRADASYTIVSNLLANGNVRLGTFSTSHTALSGNSGALLYVKVKADPDFAGGTLSMTNVLFVGDNDHDVEFADYSIQLGTVHNNTFYIPDFKIAVGETKTIGVVLDNETPFTAFQTDIYLPDGLTIVANSFKLTDRGAGDHTITAKSFDDGRTRVACFATNNVTFTGNNGVLLEFNITANKDVAETCTIELKNQLFSTTSAKEYVLPNSSTVVTTERALVKAILLNYNSYELFAGETLQLLSTIQPVFAFTMDVEWRSSNPEIATVSPTGFVNAIAPGSAFITCLALDGSGVSAACEVTIKPIPVESVEITANSNSIHVGESLVLTATILPASATDKSIEWSLSEDGIVNITNSDNNTATVEALSPGAVNVIASTPDGISSSYLLEILSNLATSISLDKTNAKLSMGKTLQLTATVLPDNTTNKELNWASNNPEIATVSETGLVTAIKPGACEITASTTDGSDLTTLCNVEVVQPVTNIALCEHELLLHPNETFTLVAIIEPVDATDKSVKWESSNEDIATVDDLGSISTNQDGREGETIISVATLDGSNLTDECVVTVKKDDSGIETITMDDVNISVNSHQVIVSELKNGVVARLFTLDGVMLNTAVGNGTDIIFDIVPNTYYILNIANFSLKLTTK